MLPCRHFTQKDTYLARGSGRVVLPRLHRNCRPGGHVQGGAPLAALPRQRGRQLLGLAGVGCRHGHRDRVSRLRAERQAVSTGGLQSSREGAWTEHVNQHYISSQMVSPKGPSSSRQHTATKPSWARPPMWHTTWWLQTHGQSGAHMHRSSPTGCRHAAGREQCVCSAARGRALCRLRHTRQGPAGRVAAQAAGQGQPEGPAAWCHAVPGGAMHA